MVSLSIRYKMLCGGLGILILLVVISCKKPTDTPLEIPESLENGLLTINEGLFQQNNSTLTWYDLYSKKVYHHVFEQKTGMGLGDTGNDIALYGDKIYVVVNNSHTLHVLNKRTGEVIARLTLSNNNSGSSPRHIAFYQDHAYISAFDGSIFKIDTTTITIQQIAQAGTNPDAVHCSGGHLIVANSGGLTSTGDSTISVFQLPELNEVARIKVGRNPGSITEDHNGNLFVMTRGDYAMIPARLIRLNLQTLEIEAEVELGTGAAMTFAAGKLYLAQYNSSLGTSKLMVMHPQTLAVEQDDIIENLSIQTLYGIRYMQIAGQGVLALNDAKQYIHQGKVVIIDLEGNLLFEYTSGLNPNKTIYIPQQ